MSSAPRERPEARLVIVGDPRATGALGLRQRTARRSLRQREADQLMELIGVAVGAEPRQSAPTGVLLDARDAASYLGISVRHLRAATAAHQVACVRLRGRGTGARDSVRWRRADLDAWVDANTQLALGPPTPLPKRPATSPRRRKAARLPDSDGVLSAKAALRSIT